ncbi:MAG: helix-turn-helix domain-containing protein [Lachnospiraceae bacterium]|nr:helix-turn-helix domain-containing protein [Lachnospiraceae bacterium]
MKKSDLDILTEELMEDPDFREEYHRIQPEMDIKRALMQARIDAGMTQVQLSEATGISQADISRLENGTRNPSLGLLKRLADAMNATLRIEFVPNIQTKAKA